VLRRVRTTRSIDAIARRSHVTATGPIAGNRCTAIDAPTWIETIDVSRKAVGGSRLLGPTAYVAFWRIRTIAGPKITAIVAGMVKAT
jgi:hypothetical protein